MTRHAGGPYDGLPVSVRVDYQSIIYDTMKALLSNYWKWALSLLFAVGVALFWALPYAGALSYQEQYQLFLFDGGYLCERLSVPGGLADYVAEYVTQFYYVYVVGAVLLALVFLLLQRLTARLFVRCGVSQAWYVLTFVPVLTLWAHMGNENVLLSLAVALLAAQALMLCYVVIDDHARVPLSKMVYLALVPPLFWWLFGACVWVVLAFVLLYEVRQHGPILVVVGAVAYMAVLVYLSGYFLQYPMYMLFGGINYFRYASGTPWMQWVVMGVFALLPVAASWLPELKGREGRVQVVSLAAVALLGTLMVRSSFRADVYDLIDYDYYVRGGQWDKVLEKARRGGIVSPMSVSCVNLALAQQGQLCDRLFEYPQNGAEGLFPSFTRDMTSPVPTSEIFFALGMVNDAERYAFEAQEAIPNFRKSGRLTKRLVECNIVNGQYAVAAKYLRMLQKSLFYDDWAEQQMRFIGNDEAVAADPLYGRLRALRIKHADYLFSDREMDQMLGLLFVDGKRYDNRMAYEYIIAYELLQRDLQRFKQYYPLGQYVQFDHIPYAIQQVLIGLWAQQHGTLQGIPYSVDRQNVTATADFLQAYMTNKEDPRLTQPPLSYNAWRYLLLDNTKKKGKEKMREIY